jgi:hypothetical protein
MIKHTLLQHIQVLDDVWSPLLQEQDGVYHCSGCTVYDPTSVGIRVHIYNKHFEELTTQILKSTGQTWNIKFQPIDCTEKTEDGLDNDERETSPDEVPSHAPGIHESRESPDTAPSIEDNAPQCPKEFPCILCKESSAKSVVGLITHVVTHNLSLAALMADQLCPLELKTIDDENSKFLRKMFGSVELLYCPALNCNYVNNNEEELSKHKQAHEHPLSICQKCWTDFPTKEENKKHNKSCQFNRYQKWISDLGSEFGLTTVKLEAPDPIISCSHQRMGCRELFWTKQDMHQHARVCGHRPSTSFPCQVCKVRIYYEADFITHMKKNHPGVSYKLQ